MKKIRLLFPALLCAASYIFVTAANIQQNLSESIVRMHIIANSNSVRDQNIKLTVRNEILAKMNALPDAEVLTAAANNSLSEMNVPYTASVCREYCYVPEKQYKSLSLPEGYYDCIKVVLGGGNGENWWCVAYPPLCFTEDVFGELSADGRKYLSENLNSDTLDAIIKNGDVNIKFRLVELIQHLRLH